MFDRRRKGAGNSPIRCVYPHRWAGLDGLRGCAVITVILFHLNVLPSGFLGVDVFFVLSGFLITTLVLDEHARTGSVSLRRFYFRRAMRLYPALLTMVAFCLAVAVGTRSSVAAVSHDAVISLAYVTNLVPLKSGLLDHTWTLALEEQFYLLWPALLLMALRRRRSLWSFVPAVALVVAILVVDLLTGHAGISATYVRAMGLPLGCALALSMHRKRAIAVIARFGWPSAVALGALVTLVVPQSLTTGWPISLGAVLAVPVVAMLTTRRVRLFEATALRWFGLRSYSLYLWHFPVLALTLHHSPSGLPVLAKQGIGLLLSLIAGESSYRLVEQPVLRLRERLTGPRSSRPRSLPTRVPGDAMRVRTSATSTPAVQGIRRNVRVVYLDHIARLSGGEIALTRLLSAVRETVDAHVILGEDGPLREHLTAAGATVEVIPMTDGMRDARKGSMTVRQLPWRSATDFLAYVFILRGRLRELQPDLVHTNSLKSALYGGLAARLAGVPVVWHIRDRIADDYLPKPAVHLVRTLARILPTRIVTDSVTTLATLPFSAQTQVLYNAFTPSEIHSPTMVSEGDSVQPMVIGMMGRLAAWKGQDVFLRAFAQAFPHGGERARIIGNAMFGEENYECDLRDLAEQLSVADRVEWRGFRADVDAELAALDVLVHASITAEPFGQVVVEGMAAGLPVIASADGGPVEIIDDGIDGLLSPPGDVGALAAAMRRLADDPVLRHRLGVAAREASTRFSPEAAATALTGLYQQVTA